MGDDVVLAPEPRVLRHRDDEAAAGGDDPRELAQRRAVIGEVLEDVERDREVKRIVVERQRVRQRAGADLADVARARGPQRRLRELDPGDRPALGELDHVAPGSAAGVEDAGRGRRVEPVEDRRQHTPAAAVPPMLLLGLEGPALERVVHARYSVGRGSCAPSICSSTTNSGRPLTWSKIRPM